MQIFLQKNSRGFAVTGDPEKDLITHLHEFQLKRWLKRAT